MTPTVPDARVVGQTEGQAFQSKSPQPTSPLLFWFLSWLALVSALAACAIVAALFCVWILFHLFWRYMDVGSAG